MAQFSIFKAQILEPVAGSSFSSGDEIDVLWDDSTSSIALKKNGTTLDPEDFLVAFDSFGQYDINYVLLGGATSWENGYAISGYSFCNGSDLKWFKMPLHWAYYPFAELQTTQNSPVCNVNGTVCDIHFVGAPIVVHTTSLSKPNGSITVEAVSSNGGVRYGLSDFGYARGSITGYFGPGIYPPPYDELGGLGPGEYTVYAKDVNDCTAQIKVFVFYKPIGNEHYRLTWNTLNTGNGISRRERVRIYEREYVGSVVEIEYGDTSPFHLQKPKQGEINDKFYPIHPTSATLKLTSLQPWQYLPLFTQDNKKFRVVQEVEEDSGFVEVRQGFILPSVFREMFLMGIPHKLEVQIADNVKTLEEEDFVDDNKNSIVGDWKLIKIIAFIMKKTGLELKIRSCINIFEENHVQNSDGSSDPLDQTYIDVTCYRDSDGVFNCWRVLECILRPFGARIIQEDNQWVIEEIDRATAEYAYRIFDKDGNYESNSTFNPLMDVKNPTDTDRAVMVEGGHSLEVIPAYGRIEITSELNYIGSIVAGGFEKEDLLSPNAEEQIISQCVFLSEEGFKDWTLRLNGTTGVSFGRILLLNSGSINRTGVDRKDLVRSVGAFYYNPGSWSGNLRDAYIESAEKPYQYGPGDILNFTFEYSTPARPEYEFMVLRMMIKVGNFYLQRDLQWGEEEAIYRAYPSISNSLQKFELSFPAPETDVVVDSTIQVRLYYYNPYFYDYGLPSHTNDPSEGTEGLTGLRETVTVGVDYDYRVDVRIVFGLINDYFRTFFELRRSSADESIEEGIIHPNDFNATTNPRNWYALKSINVKSDETQNRRRGLDLKFYVDNVALDVFVNGQPPPEEEKIELQISDFINEKLEVPLYNFDVPDITNAKNMYNNHFKLSDGTPTSKWARTGVAESLKLQQILLKVLGANHSAPTFRLTGAFMNESERIRMTNYLRITKPGSNLSMSNMQFTDNLDGWTGDGSGSAFSYSSDNGGCAEVVLSGAFDSEKFYQNIEQDGGHIEITIDLYAVPTAENDREDQLWLLFYKDNSIVHTEKLLTIAAPTSPNEYVLTYIAYLPMDIDRVGFYFKKVEGTEECKYQVGEFNVEGKDVQEVYQIADYRYDERLSTGVFELMQISKSYITLSGIDSGGTNQSGNGDGNPFNGDFNNDFGGDFDTILN